jgi:hypothetical protein
MQKFKQIWICAIWYRPTLIIWLSNLLTLSYLIKAFKKRGHYTKLDIYVCAKPLLIMTLI